MRVSADPAAGDRAARATIAVASGKGGVGKSTVSLNLALALAERGAATGILDADLYGPDIPLMVNLKQTRRLERWTLYRAGGDFSLEPVERFGIKIMSVGLLLAEEQAFSWPPEMLESALRQLVGDVRWGRLEFLIVDLPPGTAEVQQHLLRLMAWSGAIVVVTPQDVAHLDARKLLEMLADAKVPVLGAVENMSGMLCPHCNEPLDVFPRVAADRSIWSSGVVKLGRVPVDPALAEAGDRGRPLLVSFPDGPQAHVFRTIAGELSEALERRSGA